MTGYGDNRRPQKLRWGALLAPLRRRGFRYLWLGQGISLLGDQFYLIALPWLVLQSTGSVLAMGTVLALAGIPRAAFMLLGGVLTDKFNPKTLLIASNGARMVLVGALSLLVFKGFAELWTLYLFALLFGMADAFFFPAQHSIVPELVERHSLKAANALISLSTQLSLMAGPFLAGVCIAYFSNLRSPGTAFPGQVSDAAGIAFALAFDALTFLFSILLFLPIKSLPPTSLGISAPSSGGFIALAHELVAIVRGDALLLFVIGISALGNLLVTGPLYVGVPVLADTRFPDGPQAYGFLMSANGAGILFGSLFAGVLPPPKPRRLGKILLLLLSFLGLGLILLNFTRHTGAAAAVILAMGISNGYVVITILTWLQSRTPAHLLGRVMSLLLFASQGLNPISLALAGALAQCNPGLLFLLPGGLMTFLMLLLAGRPIAGKMR